MAHGQPPVSTAPDAKTNTRDPKDQQAEVEESSTPSTPSTPTTPTSGPERRGSTFMKFMSSILGSKNPIANPADPQTNTVWLFDNTAYQSSIPASPKPDQAHSTAWRAEVVACIFESQGRKDVGKFVATIADQLGIDGAVGGADEETRQRIEKRVQPFLDQVSPGRTITMDITIQDKAQSHSLGPSDRNGIISQVVELGSNESLHDQTYIASQAQSFENAHSSMKTYFAAPEGWLVVSDIDDTIKRTMTREPTGILRTTFAEEPAPIKGMPEFYKYVHRELKPTWFYLSASPYNLYPFLHSFLNENYCAGTLVLRDYSWMDISGLIKSFTEKTQEYKTDRMEKIHRNFPQRRVLCIGDSTQKDPEAYAEMYRRYPEWIHAIAIRKVTDVAHMEEHNKPERFEEAFKGVPTGLWTVFEDPVELYDFVDNLGMEEQVL
ncbi:hypothetical protein N7468_002917 [Penicillium chermesinum]|uniref:Phosphatidate phosphatase APP1 catalytic domain-containing protein n=1 Tax=Penicillium chermesinum TaxID=63820 RepID=A0A9W9TRR5_9EURO|nr:uncharacterized protein N7468_002917 [Penicillium chermesinum]KAJ5238298.1 hypothetical protein N7468_002917 [Penicillium chermesinum]KAJ6163965.1 hypothetical protein N7470_002637 [Penicillium chermesinum]